MTPPKKKTRKPSIQTLIDAVCQHAWPLAFPQSVMAYRVHENALLAAVDGLFARHDEMALIRALDRWDLKAEAISGADHILLEYIEHRAQCLPSLVPGQPEGGLFLLPVMIWSRFPIPVPTLSHAKASEFSAFLRDSLFQNPDLRFCFLDTLITMPELPLGYIQTADLAQDLQQGLHAGDVCVSSSHLSIPHPEQIRSDPLSDVRYLVGFFQPQTTPWVFPWDSAPPEEPPLTWISRIREKLAPLFLGCALEPLLPNLYFFACEQVEEYMRPHALHSAVSYLITEFSQPVDQFYCTMALFTDETDDIAELRIGFGLQANDELIHGMVWPVSIDELEETPNYVETVAAFLRDYNLGSITVIEEVFPLEYCEDCGSPLYVSRDGELVHIEADETYTPHSTTLH